MPLFRKKNSYENWEGPTEIGSDGKAYPKGQAPHSNKHHSKQSSGSSESNESYNWHSTISSGNRSASDSLFTDNKYEKSSEQRYKEMKRRIEQGKMPFTEETIKFFQEMGWYDLIDLARRYVHPEYSDENADWKYHYEQDEKRSKGLGRIFGRKKSEAEIIAENIFNSVPDITERGAAKKLHPDKMPEEYRQLANDTLAHLNEMIQERDRQRK